MSADDINQKLLASSPLQPFVPPTPVSGRLLQDPSQLMALFEQAGLLPSQLEQPRPLASERLRLDETFDRLCRGHLARAAVFISSAGVGFFKQYETVTSGIRDEVVASIRQGNTPGLDGRWKAKPLETITALVQDLSNAATQDAVYDEVLPFLVGAHTNYQALAATHTLVSSAFPPAPNDALDVILHLAGDQLTRMRDHAALIDGWMRMTLPGARVPANTPDLLKRWARSDRGREAPETVAAIAEVSLEAMVVVTGDHISRRADLGHAAGSNPILQELIATRLAMGTDEGSLLRRFR